MRRTAAVLVLLVTESMARAGYADGGGELTVVFYGMACCATVPFLFMLSAVTAAIIYDWRKARRTKAPAPGE